jgi:hypothetical protein
MKYRICEMTLNEYVNHPVEVQIDVIEANSPEEAHKQAMLRWPNRGPFKVDTNLGPKVVREIVE